jgi:hypothetical protein
MGGPSGSGKESGTARVLGSGAAGITELCLFHPTDTVAKRLMSSTKSVVVRGDFGASMANANTIIFRDAANLGVVGKAKSMFPGFGFAAGYKVLQRVYKFGGQPACKDLINAHAGPALKQRFGKNTGAVLASGAAGAIMGVGEIALLPLDVLKIKAQTNPAALKGRGLVELCLTEGRGLYRGAGWTAARNAPGSFALFGGSALVHHGVYGLEHAREASVMQNFVASIAGAIASITVAAPLDVVKTRVQNKPFDAPESGVQIVRKLIRDEGFSAFFKGLTPKIIVVGPKLIFSYTVAMSMISFFDEKLKL